MAEAAAKAIESDDRMITQKKSYIDEQPFIKLQCSINIVVTACCSAYTQAKQYYKNSQSAYYYSQLQHALDNEYTTTYNIVQTMNGLDKSERNFAGVLATVKPQVLGTIAQNNQLS